MIMWFFKAFDIYDDIFEKYDKLTISYLLNEQNVCQLYYTNA